MGKNLKTGGAKTSGSTSIVLPGRKLATSKNPRILTPSEIDLLRKDLKAALKVVGQDEIDDALALIREHGFQSSDFEIVQRSDSSPPYPSHVSGQVTVRRKSNSAARHYDAGSHSTWLSDLELDLKK